MKILVLNAGSSTLKFQLFDARSADVIDVRLKGVIERIGTAQAGLRVTLGELHMPEASNISSMRDAAELIIHQLAGSSIDAIGYRVVHGGDRFEEPTRITPDVVNEINALTEMAPLHNSGALQCIDTGLRLLPRTVAVAVFDTSFHCSMPEVARRYAIPRDLADQYHLHRFGFHGISHRYVSKQLLNRTGRTTGEQSRLITCHLGSGASVCAIRDGQSIDTSMGMTPLEGLIMGTRSGDLDPGLVLHLMRVLKMSVDDVDDLLNHRSGLMGLSGKSADVRDLEKAAQAGDTRCEAAMEAFAYRCRKYIGAYAAVLGGVDGIAFAGGVGEHSPGMRARIVRGLEFLGVTLNQQQNNSATGDSPVLISSGVVGLWLIPTNEEQQVAEEVFHFCNEPRRDPAFKENK